MKNTITRNDILEYIEEKILRNEHEEWEYEFYSEYKWDGIRVFKERRYQSKLKGLVNQLKEELDANL